MATGECPQVEVVGLEALQMLRTVQWKFAVSREQT
jgi:hypothetical protein